MSGSKSKTKGKVGEREAVKLLKSLGYPDAQRTAQYNGKGDSDVIAPESLPGLTIEVKYGYPHSTLSVGSEMLANACEQAYLDAGRRPWIVLWRNKGSRIWRMTCDFMGMTVTVAGGDIVTMLERWEADLSGEPDPEAHRRTA